MKILKEMRVSNPRAQPSNSIELFDLSNTEAGLGAIRELFSQAMLQCGPTKRTHPSVKKFVRNQLKGELVDIFNFRSTYCSAKSAFWISKSKEGRIIGCVGIIHRSHSIADIKHRHKPSPSSPGITGPTRMRRRKQTLADECH